MMLRFSSLPPKCKQSIVRFRNDYRAKEAVRANFTDLLRIYYRIKASRHLRVLFSISGEHDGTGTAQDWMDVLDDLGLMTEEIAAELGCIDMVEV